MKRLISNSVFVAILSFSLNAQAEFINPSLPGTTQQDDWKVLTAGNYPGYPDAFLATPWSTPITANTPGSAALNKTSGTGSPFHSSLYSGGFNSTPNTFGGGFVLSDSAPVAGLETVLFQIEIGEAFGFDFWNEAFPTLSYNEGTQALVAPIFALISSEFAGTFPNPEGGEDLPIFINTWGFQWDLSGISEPITSFEINWSVVQHSQTYDLQLNQGDTFAMAIPEPSSLALLIGALGVGGFFAVRRRLHSLS